MWVNARWILPLVLAFGQTVAGESWSDPQEIGIHPAPNQVSADLSSDGAAVVVYNRMEASEDNKLQMWVEANSRSKDGKWSTPQRLSPKTPVDWNIWIYPQAAIDSSGFSYAIWKYFDGEQQGLKSAFLPYSSWYWWQSDDWGGFPCPLADSIGDYQIAAYKNQCAIALWSAERNGGYSIEGAFFDPQSSRPTMWSALPSISIASKCKTSSLNAKVDSEGTIWIIWSNFSDDLQRDKVCIASLAREASSWSEPFTLSIGKEVWEPKLSIDPKGNLLARWQKIVGDRKLAFEGFKKQADSDVWKKTQFPDLDNKILDCGEVTFDQKGNALLIWDQSDDQKCSLILSKDSYKWKKYNVISKECIGAWGSAIDKKGNRLFAFNNIKENLLKVSTLPANNWKQWSKPVTITSSNYLIDYVGLAGEKALIVYEDDGNVKAVSGQPFK